MNWTALSAVAELLGAVGVIASLVYVGIQVRQNTKATRAQIHDRMTAGYLSVVNAVTKNARVFSAALGTSRAEFARLSNEDRMIFFSVIFGFFKHFEHMYVQQQRGLIDREAWEAWSQHIRSYFHQPGVQMWWAVRRGTFVRPFREFLENSVPPPDVPSFVEFTKGLE